MAVSGSATSAYRVYVATDGELVTVPTTALGSMCTKPSVALGMAKGGSMVTVAGSDMAELRRLWREWQAQP